MSSGLRPCCLNQRPSFAALVVFPEPWRPAINTTVGGFDASGDTIIEGLVLSGSVFGALLFDGSLFVNPDPNTILFSGVGLSIILNEQILSSGGIETNAIHIAFNDFALGTGLKNGDIILAHTEAFATTGSGGPGAVPEPATWAMMLIGFGAVGAGMRRRWKLALIQVA